MVGSSCKARPSGVGRSRFSGHTCRVNTEKAGAGRVETEGQGMRGWLAWGPRESGPVDAGRKTDKGSTSQAVGWTEHLLPAVPTALMPGTAWPPPSPRLCWLPASHVGGKRSPSAHMTKKGHLLSRKVGLGFLFPPPEVSGSQGSGFFSHIATTGQIEQGAYLPRCSDVKMSSGPNHYHLHPSQLSS